MIARGRVPSARAAASATAHMPNNSAAGMDKRVVGTPLSPRCAASARRSAFVAAERRSASSTSR
eukprot:2645999-Pleurochrysis_carterae.AAC.1